MAIFVKLGDLKGEVKVEGFKDWMQMESAQWGLGRGIAAATTRGGGGRESSAPSVSEITFTKQLDNSDGLIIKGAFGGGAVGKAFKTEIKFTQTDNNGAHKSYLDYELSECLISGYSMSSGGDSRPSMNFSVNFTKFMSTYWFIDAEFNATKGDVIQYDVTTGKTS